MPLTNKDRKIAERFSENQSQPQKREQVYYNSLAVLAVNNYCRWMEISTDITGSDSWNPIAQTLGNVADLCLGSLGKIECRPVRFDASVVEVPAEVWHDRIGYLAIQFDEGFTQAKFIGFLERIERENIPLNEWRSLDDFLDLIERLETVESYNYQVHLGNWLQGIFEGAWEGIETITRPYNLELGWNFRQRSRSSSVTSNSHTSEIERVKIVSLEPPGTEMALLLGVTPTTPSELDISVELYPTQAHSHLPQELQLMILDHSGKSVMQAEAGGSERLLFKFSGESGEQFSIKIAWREISVTETFVI
ncbi:DUF1822 family protein [Capilliphycus salinus ALCB114379]|uniref:DUF1822 family protein n=1 Tax=Capilliphycus salinus TaxID=2768948 RepID=UPI0039A49EDE